MSDSPADSGTSPKPSDAAEKPIYDLAPATEHAAAPAQPALPKGTVVERASKVGDKSLIDDFDEDADFSKDPQVERALGGGSPAVKAEPVDLGPAFVKPGLGDLRQIGIAAGVVLLAAIIAAAITADGRNRQWYADAILTGYLGVFHAATGAAAVMFAAYINRQRLGDLPLAAARMGLAVACFQLLFHINIPIAGRSDEVIAACAAYAACTWILFRWSREQITLVVCVHALLWGAMYAATGLWYWAQKKTGA
jgi:hypothetical protein